MVNLSPADIMLYRPRGVVGWLIASRTWSNWAHVEVYIGGGKSVASRDCIGVGCYDVRWDDLGAVIRPHATPDMHAGLSWFWSEASGQKYDYLALLRFVLPHFIKRDLDMTRQICSSLAVRFLRKCGVDIVSPEVDADLIAPSDIAKTSAGSLIHYDGKGI